MAGQPPPGAPDQRPAGPLRSRDLTRTRPQECNVALVRGAAAQSSHPDRHLTRPSSQIACPPNPAAHKCLSPRSGARHPSRPASFQPPARPHTRPESRAAQGPSPPANLQRRCPGRPGPDPRPPPLFSLPPSSRDEQSAGDCCFSVGGHLCRAVPEWRQQCSPVNRSRNPGQHAGAGGRPE